MAMYEYLGVHPSVISSWKQVHKNWKYRNAQFKGELSEMRLTGQATTAIGNVITNMQVHAEFAYNHRNSLR